MRQNSTSKREGLYGLGRLDRDLSNNLHRLYDRVTEEPVPDYLLDLLKKLPEN